MLNNKKVLTGAVAIVGSMCMFAGSVGAFSWGKKKNSLPPEPVNEVRSDSEMSVELLEAKKVHNEAVQETQTAYSLYQSTSIEYKEASSNAIVAYENSQKKTAEWTEAAAARDLAASTLDADCVSSGVSRDKYVAACNKANEAYAEKERAYVEWVSRNKEQKDANKRREEAHNQYIDALTKQKNAFENWIKVSSHQQ